MQNCQLRSFMVLFACLALVSPAAGQLIVDFDVVVTEADGLYTYDYTLKNSEFSGLGVNALLIDTAQGAEIEQFIFPENWVYSFDPDARGSNIGFVAGDGQTCDNEDADIYEGEQQVFTVISRWAPEPKPYFIGKLTSDCSDFLGTAIGEIPAPSRPTGRLLECDFDGDGDCDLVDIDRLGAAIMGGNNPAEFDLNDDALVDLDDLGQFLGHEEVGRVNGDANFDGTVNFADFLILSSNYNNVDGAWSEGNFIPSQRIDFADFLTLSNNFNASATATAVPEPRAGLLFLGSAVCLAGVVRRKR